MMQRMSVNVSIAFQKWIIPQNIWTNKQGQTQYKENWVTIKDQKKQKKQTECKKMWDEGKQESLRVL